MSRLGDCWRLYSIRTKKVIKINKLRTLRRNKVMATKKKSTTGLAVKAKKKVEGRGKRVDSAMDRMLAGKSPQKKKKK